MSNEVKVNSVVIIGAGHAGGSAAAQLRTAGYKGDITLVGDEDVAPYQRPPLSKAYLAGSITAERLYLRPLSYYQQQEIDLRTGIVAEYIERGARQVHLKNGQLLAYDRLILATGASARRIAPELGGALDGVQTLRTLADVDALKARLHASSRIVVLGAGYIGREAAAALRQMGHAVTVLEAQQRVLSRVAGQEVAAFYASLHRQHGVDLLLNARFSRFVGEDGGLTGVALDDGSHIDADLALVGIGVLPNEALAHSAGIHCDNGVLVDANARTSDPYVYAIGDCCVRPLLRYGRTGRLESVHNALEQARLVAHHIMELAPPAQETPWFWSDQYGIKLQTAGLLSGYDQTIVRGDPEASQFAVYYLSGGRLLAVDAINAMADFMAGKRLAGAYNPGQPYPSYPRK